MAKYVGFKIGKVHESHVVSEYYCGGCGFPVTDHDSFCPECGGAFRECDADDFESENAKLRDIAHDMWRLLLATGNDDLVLSIEASGVVKEVIDAEELAKAMRELGIEV